MGQSASVGVKCEHEHEVRAQGEMCKVGCILFVPLYLYVQVI